MILNGNELTLNYFQVAELTQRLLYGNVSTLLSFPLFPSNREFPFLFFSHRIVQKRHLFFFLSLFKFTFLRDSLSAGFMDLVFEIGKRSYFECRVSLLKLNHFRVVLIKI